MNLVVVGCGRLGAALARSLEDEGHGVAVLDPSAEALERLGPGFKGRRVRGDPLDRAALEAAGVERADGLAATADSDNLNLAVASAARRLFRVPRVVARLHDPRRARTYHRMGVQTFSPLPSSVRRVAFMLSHTPLDRVASLGAGHVDLVEVAVPPALAGRTFGSLDVAGEIRPVALTRHGHTSLPPREAPLEEGDRVLAAVTGAAAGRLRQLLGLE